MAPPSGKQASQFPLGFRIVGEGRESLAIAQQLFGQVVSSLFSVRRTGVLEFRG